MNLYEFVTSTMTRTLYSQSSAKDFNLEKQIDTYLQPVQSKEKEFWKNAFIMDYYSFYKIRKEQAFLEQASILLNLAKEQFHPYLEYVITIVTNFASEISDTLLLKKFVDIINPYTILLSAESQLKMANIYINLQNKTAAEEMLNKAKIHIKNEDMQKEYDKLVSTCKLLK